jgi:lipopolysaccharide transport system permease protein
VSEHIKQDGEWTQVISPKKGLLEIDLGAIWRYRDLIALFVRRDFVSQYKQTILGPIWFFLQPIFTTLTFFVIFSRVANLSTDGIPPILFYMAGTNLWTYFSDCFQKTSTTFLTNANIFGKVYFPRLVTPISIVISSFIKFGVQMLLFLIVLGYYAITVPGSVQPNWTIILLPYLLLLMAGISLGMGIIFSSLTTKYRDLVFLLQFAIQLLMYAAPVVFPLSSAHGKLQLVFMANPMTAILETWRYAFFSHGYFSWALLAYSTLFTLGLLGVGILLFNQIENDFMDTV